MDLLPCFQLLPLLLLLVAQPVPTVGGGCPEGCFCSSSIFCTQRQATTVPRDLPVSTKNLYLFKNGIGFLNPEDFSGLDHLEMLDLSQNKLSELPDRAFKPLVALRNLDLSFNQIRHISQNTFSGLTLLERLYLHENNIESIHPSAFWGLQHLLELKLQGNMLKSVPELRLPKLLLLNLSFNNILKGSLEFKLITPQLESLKLSGMGLSRLDEDFFTGLTNLRELDLSRNQLRELPRTVSLARELSHLHLAGNPLEPLRQEDFLELSALKELDISGLKLQGLSQDFLEMFPRLTELTAAENPFNCVCSLAWLPGWLQARGVRLNKPENTRCHFPPHNAGKQLGSLEHRDFGCPVTTIAAPVTTRMPKQLLFTTLSVTTPALPLIQPTNGPPKEVDREPLPPALTSVGSAVAPTSEVPVCPEGSGCKVHGPGRSGCACSPGTLGPCCERQDKVPQLQPVPTETTATIEPDIVPREVTATSIQVDLQRYVEARPHIRGVRLTYRNLSGPDRRPVPLNLPTSYVKYTLRGLRPNSTYSICASPHGEPISEARGSCMEASTISSLQTVSSERQAEQGYLTTVLGATLAAVLVVLLVAVIAGAACHLKRRKTKDHIDPDLGEPSLLELGGVKSCMDNGTLLQKQPEVIAPLVQNGVNYEVPLPTGRSPGSNNMAVLKPSYF